MGPRIRDFGDVGMKSPLYIRPIQIGLGIVGRTWIVTRQRPPVSFLL